MGLALVHFQKYWLLTVKKILFFMVGQMFFMTFFFLVPFFQNIYTTSFYVQKVAKIEFSPICNASSSFPEYLDIKKGKKSKGKGKIVDLKIASSKRHLLVGKMTILGQDSHSWLLSGFLNHCNCAKGNHDFLLRIRASSSGKGVKQGKYRYPSHP